MSAALAALREYVTAGDTERYSNLPEGFIRIDVTHSNLAQRWHDVLVYVDSSVLDLKHKLFRKNGTLVDSMELFIRNGTCGETIYMADDSIVAFELSDRNSGQMEGKFAERGKKKNPETGKN